MALVKKRIGAPAGTIKVSVGNRSYTFDDASNAQVEVSDPGAYAELISHPYLDAVSGSSSFTPPPSVKFAYIVDGTLSEQTGPSTYSPIAGGGSSVTLPFKEVNGGNGAAIQAALNIAKHVYVGAGTYTVGTTLQFAANNQTLEFSSNVKIQATGSVATLVEDNGFDRCTVKGRSTEFDLNGIGVRAVYMHGNGTTYIKKPKVTGCWAHGNNTTVPNNTGAFDISLADRPEAGTLEVYDYGYDIGPNNCYGLAFDRCIKPRYWGIDVSHARIGVRLAFCADSKGSKLDVKDTSDNGVYCLGTPVEGTGRHKLSQFTIDNSEEGFVAASNNDDVTLSNGSILNCRNKGITVRSVKRFKAQDVRFAGNNCHIGDDDVAVADDAELRGCTFDDQSTAIANYLQLRRFRRLRIVECGFKTTTNTKALILIAGAADGSGSDNIIERCKFEDVNKTVTTEGLIRVATQDGYASGNTIRENHFIEAVTAIQFFNASGTPATGNSERRNRFDDVTTPVLFTSTVRYVSEPLVVRPSEVAALAWYDAAQTTATADAAAIAQWNDSSGNSRHLLQATAGNQPTWRAAVFNGMPAVRFDGVDDFMASAGFTLNQPYELFVVGKQSAAGNGRVMVDGLTANSGALLRSGTSTTGFNAGTAVTVSSANPQDKTRLWHVTVDGANSVLRSDQNTAAVNPGTANPGGVTVGAAGGGAASWFPGDIAEVLITPILTTGQRIGIRAYFAQKYRDPIWR